MSMKSANARYGTVAVTIHWLTAALIVGLFATGLLAAGQADSPAQFQAGSRNLRADFRRPFQGA